MTEVKGKRVFLSGPMTGLRHNNVGAFADAHALLVELGAREVFDPAVEWLRGRPFDPEGKMSHGDYLRWCLHELTKPGAPNRRPWYDLLVSLPGWERSAGAIAERDCAGACAIPVADLADLRA